MSLLTYIKIQVFQFSNSVRFSEEKLKKIRALKDDLPDLVRPDFSETSGSAEVGDIPASMNKKQYDHSLGIDDQRTASNSAIDSNSDKTKTAFEFVVSTRQFEIELYWKRATYFWTFIAAVFVAYVALRQLGEGYEFETLLVSAVGIILSLAWHFSNLGSKSWQRHWEKHLDLMEDNFMGPLYKTVNSDQTYSVSKINEIVSFVFVVVWILLFASALESSYDFPKSVNDIDWIPTILVLMICAGICMAFCSMVFGKGRGRIKAQKVKMYRRDYKFD